MECIALIGLPGSGKTTVGRLLARRRGVPFVDTDDAIEQHLGCSIRSFFEAQGEDAFRDAESEVLHGLVQAGVARVLSTGGGIVLRPQNRDWLRQNSRVVYLHATPDDLYQRLRHDTKRPLLQADDPMARLRALHDAREPLYRETAHLVVEAGRARVHQVIAGIEAALQGA